MEQARVMNMPPPPLDNDNDDDDNDNDDDTATQPGSPLQLQSVLCSEPGPDCSKAAVSLHLATILGILHLLVLFCIGIRV